MSNKNLETVLVTLAEKIQQQQIEISHKDYTINNLKNKLKFYEEREEIK